MPGRSDFLSPHLAVKCPPPRRLCSQPLDALSRCRPKIASTQPGGGVCYSARTGLGPWRRWYFKTFRRGYVERMRQLRHGDPAGCPHEVLDPRDLKFCRNQTDCHWDAADDPFRWRERIPFARWGLAELQLMGWPLLAITVALACLAVVSGARCRESCCA